LKLKSGQIALGVEIAKLYNIKIGDSVVLAFGKGNAEMKAMPALERFVVTEIISHGIYQKMLELFTLAWRKFKRY